MSFNRQIFLATNIPTPYRQDFYTELAIAVQDKGGELMIDFMAKSEYNRSWTIPSVPFSYRSFFENARLRRYGSLETYLSIRPWLRWLAIRPSTTILAGAWHYPSNILIVLTAVVLSKACWFWCEANEHTDKTVGRFANLMRLFFYRTCSRYCVPGRKSAEYVQHLNPTATIVRLPNSIERSFFENMRLLTLQRVTDEKYRFLTVSELTPRKGVLELIDAFERAICAGILPQEAQLNICGDGPLKAQVVALAEKNNWLVYHGFQQSGAIRQIWDKCGAFILNTKLDPNPLVVNEAAALGLVPLVSDRAGNAADIVAHSSHLHFIYSYGDLEKVFACYVRTSIQDLLAYRLSLLEYGARFHPRSVAIDLIASIQTISE
ncbi:MAG: glycosyltransferase [Candidatus Uhrbacteria bacterium]|nr:glycosyltransferase [Candidatus Uhrbacteria bacterium]